MYGIKFFSGLKHTAWKILNSQIRIITCHAPSKKKRCARNIARLLLFFCKQTMKCWLVFIYCTSTGKVIRRTALNASVMTSFFKLPSDDKYKVSHSPSLNDTGKRSQEQLNEYEVSKSWKSSSDSKHHLILSLNKV